jgi:hypothetical protein
MSKQRRDADDFVRDMKAKQQHSTPGDLERKERIDANAREALRRLKSGQTYEDWRAVGQKMMVITEEVMNELALNEWDPDNKQLTREFTRRFEGWEASVSNAKPISKQERWALRELMTDPKYHTFYTTELVGPEQRKTNHPNKIIEKYKRKHPDPNKPNRERKKPSDVLSPALAEKKERIKELEEELAAAREGQPPPMSLKQTRSAYSSLIVQFYGADQEALKAEIEQLSTAVSNLLRFRDTSKVASSIEAPKSRKRKTKTGRVIARVPGIGDIFEG